MSETDSELLKGLIDDRETLQADHRRARSAETSAINERVRIEGLVRANQDAINKLLIKLGLVQQPRPPQEPPTPVERYDTPC